MVYGAALEKRSPERERGFESHPLRIYIGGEVLEWSIRRAWRARVASATVGSNPTLSATQGATCLKGAASNNLTGTYFVLEETIPCPLLPLLL